MRRKVGIVKRMSCLLLIFLLSINSFAAIVSDNDGSAFITKAEFDALKSSFQAQIDTYNQSIDSKIDGAIASYLSGLKILAYDERDIFATDMESEGVFGFNEQNPLEYQYCCPVAEGKWIRTDLTQGVDNDKTTTTEWLGNPSYGAPGGILQVKWFRPTNLDNNKGCKTVIKKLDETKKIAQWHGYAVDAIDYITFDGFGSNIRWAAGNPNAIASNYNGAFVHSLKYSNVILPWNDALSFRFDAGKTSDGALGDDQFYIAPNIINVNHDWGNVKWPYICAISDYNYDMFSNYERDKNWGYDGSYKDTFRVAGIDCKNANMAAYLSKGANTLWSMGNYNVAWNNTIDKFTIKGWLISGNSVFNTSHPTAAAGKVYFSVVYPKNSGIKYSKFWLKDPAVDQTGTTTLYLPMVGFERAYLNNWKSIYQGEYDKVFDGDLKTRALSKGVLTDSDGKKHFSVTAGVPLIDIKKEESIKDLELNFDDKTASYDVWIKDGPFSEGDPDLETCLTLSGKNPDNSIVTKDATKNNAYVVKSGVSLQIDTFDNNATIFIKWAKINNADRSKDGGGVLYPRRSVTVQKAE